MPLARTTLSWLNLQKEDRVNIELFCQTLKQKSALLFSINFFRIFYEREAIFPQAPISSIRAPCCLLREQQHFHDMIAEPTANQILLLINR